MKLEELQDGQTVQARLGRAGRTRVEWEGGFEPHTLYVQRHKGKVIIVTLRDVSWAEGSPRDLCFDEGNEEGGTFVVEDWYLQIKGLTPD